VTVSIVIYKGLRPVVYRMLTDLKNTDIWISQIAFN
jgi:hypothetical protein